MNSSLKPFIVVVERDLAFLDAAQEFLKDQFLEYPILFDPGPIDAIHTAINTITGKTIFIVGSDLGDMSGAAVISVLKKRFRYPAFYILLVPRNEDKEWIKALDIDVCPFPRDLAHREFSFNLGPTLVSQIRFAERSLNRESTDLLTGAYNRGQALEIWRKDFLQVKKKHHSSAFFFLDVNFLHDMNVLYGDHTGDQLLQLVGSSLLQTVGAGEGIVCRQGGDEFLVILSHADRSKAIKYGRLLREIFGKLRLQVKRGGDLHVSVSVGFAVITAEEMPSDAHEALKMGANRSAKNMRKNKKKMHADVNELGGQLRPRGFYR